MSEFISLNEAKTMISRYNQQKEEILKDGLPATVLPVCETFEINEVRTLIDQTGCQNLRVYFAMDASDQIRLVLVGVNDKDEDMCSSDSSFLEKGSRCPSNCPPSSPINS